MMNLAKRFVCMKLLLAFVGILMSMSQNLEPIAKRVGATFCKYLAYKSQIPRRYFNDCGEPSCNWDDWNDALVASSTSSSVSKSIVLSYGHNGFGNQLWEHSTGFMIAESLKAQLMIAIIPDELSPNGYIPPNSWQGMSAMERMLPKEFQYELLPQDSPIRALCDKESFFIADRPIDWRNKTYTSTFKENLLALISDPKPRCIKLLGYFQNLPLCAEDAKRLWTPKLFQNVTIRPGDNDISIYLRCLPRHYHFNGRAFYENILNHTMFDNVWLFQAPECPNNLNDDPAKDGIVAAVIRFLKDTYGAKRWPGLEGTDGTAMLLHDLAGLAMSKKMILPVSSWAFWGGMFSNATEIHVNAPPHHQVMYGMNQYVYHNEKTGEYFGQYIREQNDIVYRTNLTNHHQKRLRAKAIMNTHSNVVAAPVYVEHKSAVQTDTAVVAPVAPVAPAAPVGAAVALGQILGPAVSASSSDGAKALTVTAAPKLPVVFVFTVVPAICPYGLPSYIRVAIEQAIYTQPDCDVILVSNFAECTTLRDSVKDIVGLKLVDSGAIISERTVQYRNLSSSMFQADGGGELWMTSALRFFIMEDLMLSAGYTELIHIEADNTVYGKFTSLLPVLRSGYKGMAATPLNANKSFITASVMWLSSLSALLEFNNFLLELGGNINERWKKYLDWLRPYGCCRQGGVDPDKDGNGIKPFAINEMSMLGYYHNINPDGFKIFPVVPSHTYNLNKYVVNMSRFGPHGEEVGPPTGHGVWDPNSWGQLVGGTATKKGRDKGFTDGSHIAGQAIRMNGCTLQMLCGNQTVSPYASPPIVKTASGLVSAATVQDEALVDEQDKASWKYWRDHQETYCYTAPFVRCSEDAVWTPLWNLHVHSKHTTDYRSIPCECPARAAR